MKAKNDDFMEESTSPNNKGFQFTNFGKQSLVMAAICSVFIMNADPALAAQSGAKVEQRSSFSSTPQAAVSSGGKVRGGSTKEILNPQN